MDTNYSVPINWKQMPESIKTTAEWHGARKNFEKKK
jgi:hypothetical protein